MNRILAMLIVLAASCAAAYADHAEIKYRDIIRPDGHRRSYAVFQQTLDDCYKQTGANRAKTDAPAMQQCLLGHGFKWQYTHMIHTPVRHAKRTKTWTDPETGLPCHEGKFLGLSAAVCSNF
jgi:hypothetical protein